MTANASPSSPKPASSTVSLVTLSIDIGGSAIKGHAASIHAASPISERERIPTPAVPTPHAVLRVLEAGAREPAQLRSRLVRFSRGGQKRGVTYIAVKPASQVGKLSAAS